jgi:hypothetical protein
MFSSLTSPNGALSGTEIEDQGRQRGPGERQKKTESGGNRLA